MIYLKMKFYYPIHSECHSNPGIFSLVLVNARTFVKKMNFNVFYKLFPLLVVCSSSFFCFFSPFILHSFFTSLILILKTQKNVKIHFVTKDFALARSRGNIPGVKWLSGWGNRVSL